MKDIDKLLTETYEDSYLSGDEKVDLRQLLLAYQYDADILNYARNRAFDLVRDKCLATPKYYPQSVKWLEQVVKTIDTIRQNNDSYKQFAYFSPGKQCVNQIISLIKSARNSIDVCVFTISDDRISEQLVQTHKNNIKVRILSDNDKSTDTGSDVDYFIKEGLDVRLDTTPDHMHHKFAIFDNSTLVNGSFNWTRSASRYNQENILVTKDKELISRFSSAYENIWKKCVTPDR